MKSLQNLACGARLTFFRPVSLACFHISATQAIALIAVDLALSAAVDVLRSGWPPEFSIWGSVLLCLRSAVVFVQRVARVVGHATSAGCFGVSSLALSASRPYQAAPALMSALCSAYGHTIRPPNKTRLK